MILAPAAAAEAAQMIARLACRLCRPWAGLMVSSTMMIIGFFLTTLFTDSLHRCTLRLQADLANHFPSHSSVRTTCPPAHVHHSSHCLWMFHRLAGCGGKEGSFHISRVAFYALVAFWRTFNAFARVRSYEPTSDPWHVWQLSLRCVRWTYRRSSQRSIR